MAQAGQPLLYICRSCRQSVRTASASKTARAFGTSPARLKVVPSFTPTGNAELDDLFLAWRKKVFIPGALQDHHRALIYKPSRHQTLTNDPGVTVTMSDDEEIKLEPMNFYDKPNKRESMKKVLDTLSSTNEDAVWNNLSPFLAGVTLSREQLPTFFFEKITRKASELGKERIVLHCAERSKETGFKLSKKGVTRELMLGFHNRAALHDFQGPELESAHRRAERVARMLEDELNNAGKLKANEVDPRQDLLVISVLLELAAAKRLNEPDSQGQEEKVANYATKMLHMAAGQEGGEKVTGDTSGTSEVELRARDNTELETLLPMQNAVNLALKIASIERSPLGKDLKAYLAKVDERVARGVQNLSAHAGGKERRGLLMYHQLNHGEQ